MLRTPNNDVTDPTDLAQCGRLGRRPTRLGLFSSDLLNSLEGGGSLSGPLVQHSGTGLLGYTVFTD